MTNDQNRFATSVLVVRLLAAAACLCLCVLIGCGNLGAGCNGGPSTNDNEPTGNDNIADNDNGDLGNDNEPENDNTDNDNTGTANGNANQNQNRNDNVGGGGNDNGAANTNDNAVSNSNQNGNLNGNANANANGNANGNGNSNDNTTGGGGAPVCGNGVREGTEECDDGNATPNDGCDNGCQMVATKSSGAAQPGEVVTLSLNEDLPGTSCEIAAVWTQNPADPVQVTLTDGGLACASLGEGCASFTAPAVATTTSLRFTVNIPAANCSAGAQTGSQTVPIQVANLTFNLPNQIRLNRPLDLDQSTTVTGAPAAAEVFYFAQDPLPADVALDIDQPTGVLTVTAGVGRTITIIVQVTAQAGMLAEETDTILIVP